MGGEDFSYFIMPEQGGKPGCFFFFGGKEEALQAWSRGGDASGARSNCMCHNTAFDFNDNLLPVAAVFWVRCAPPPHGTESEPAGPAQSTHRGP